MLPRSTLDKHRSVTKINGRRHYLWRAVDQHGNVLDILVTSRRDAKAAIRFFRKLLTALEYVPRVLVTEKLGTYGVAHRRLIPSVRSAGPVSGGCGRAGHLVPGGGSSAGHFASVFLGVE